VRLIYRLALEGDGTAGGVALSGALCDQARQQRQRNEQQKRDAR
jgi:hypothetical protein